jgi:hypothetical protein
MKISISNFRKVSRVDIETGPLTIIAGANAQGKTSLLQGIAAAMTGNTIPIDGLNKTHAGRLVHSGAAAGEIIIDNAVGEIKLTYPEVQRETVGAPPEISEYAAGLRSLLDLPLKQRPEVISDILKTAPTETELETEILQAMLSPEQIELYRATAGQDPEKMLIELGTRGAGVRDAQRIIGVAKSFGRLWATIQAQGWDAAHDQAQKNGARFKGQWEATAGESYGAKKAETWMPLEWDADIASATLDQLTRELVQEKEWLEAAISDQAISDTEIARLTECAGHADHLAADKKNIEESLKGLFTNEAQISAGLRLLPPATQPKTCACPYCKKPVMIAGNELRIPAILTQEEIDARALRISESESALKKVKDEIGLQNAELGRLNAEIKQSESAKIQLAKLTKKTKSGPGTDRGIDDCRARVARAEGRLKAFNQKIAADQLHESVSQNQIIVDILAPNGIRQRNLKSKIGELNSHLTNLCKLAGWGIVEVKSDMSITHSGAPYMLSSRAEMHCVRWTLQVAISMLDKSTMIIIDDVDVLLAPWRNGLVKILIAAKIPAIIGIAIQKQEECPDISRIGGRVYWIENGISEEIKK